MALVNERSKVRGLFLLFGLICFVLLVTKSQAAVVHGKITSIKGDMIELDLGSDKGLKVGDSGRVYYTVRVSGEPKPLPVYVARFKILYMSAASCMARIVGETTGEIQVGYLVEVSVQVAQQTLAPQAVKSGKLVMRAEPSDATIYLDGHSVGKGPYEKNLSPGSYRVRVEKEGYEVWEGDVTVVAEKTVEVLAQLKKREPRAGEVWKDPYLGMEFVWVAGGCYEMGCGDWAGDCEDDEKPGHTVCVDGFWMGKYEVTQGQWRRLMGDNPSHFKDCGDDCPVEQVSWNEAVEFAQRLSQRTGYEIRLPTEAEWEYACRSGGKKQQYSGGDDMGTVAWYGGESGSYPHPVGQKGANGLGIYDMSGNAWEWCEDWFDEDYYGKSPKDNPRGSSSGTERVLRGGSWGYNPGELRCAYRSRTRADFRLIYAGFRLVRVSRP